MPEPFFLELRSVSLEAGGRKILEDLNLEVEEGRTTMLVGHAGSGKSSVLKAAAGILQPTGGEVYLRGRALGSLSPREMNDFHGASGFVFQDAALWANMTLYDNIAFPYRLHRPGADPEEVREAVGRAAEGAGYPKPLDRRPAEISGGERILVGLARALVLDPPFFILDEPTASLDERERLRVYELIIRLGKAGKTILIAGASHRFAREVADAVGVLSGGRLVAWGGYENLDPTEEE